MDEKTAKISMSRYTGFAQKEKGISIEIEDEEGKLIFRGNMDYEDFAKVITGHSNQVIKRET